MQQIIIGHRGIAGHYPENTELSIIESIKAGLDWVEVDIQPTKDGQLVVCHDYTVDRCSNGTGRVDSHTLASLLTLDFGAWFGPEHAGQSILTLTRLLQLAKQHQLHLNLEVKLDRENETDVITTLKQQLIAAEFPSEQLIISSFSHRVMRALATLLPGYRLGAISDKLSEQDLALLQEINAYSCHLNYRNLTQANLAELQSREYKIFCYTVNRVDDFPLIGEVAGIFSDFPERFLSN